MVYVFTHLDLNRFGGMVKPYRAVLFIEYEPTDEHQDPNLLNHLADLFFLKGPKDAVMGWYDQLAAQVKDHENKNWWIGNDEDFYVVGFYDLPNNEMLLTFADNGCGGAPYSTESIPCPEGCSTVSIVHAESERCMEDAPEFFEDIQYLFDSIEE